MDVIQVYQFTFNVACSGIYAPYSQCLTSTGLSCTGGVCRFIECFRKIYFMVFIKCW